MTGVNESPTFVPVNVANFAGQDHITWSFPDLPPALSRLRPSFTGFALDASSRLVATEELTVFFVY